MTDTLQQRWDDGYARGHSDGAEAAFAHGKLIGLTAGLFFVPLIIFVTKASNYIFTECSSCGKQRD